MKRVRGLAVVALTLLFAACSKAPAPAPMPTPVATPAATLVPAAVGVHIRSVEVGRGVGPDKRVTDATTKFRAADTIYVAVLTEGTSAATSVTARFVYGADGQLVSESTQTIATDGPAVTEFHIAKPDGWPVGTYAVEVSLAGAPTQRTTFQVE